MKSQMLEYRKFICAIAAFMLVIVVWEGYWIYRLDRSFNQIKILGNQTKSQVLSSDWDKVQLGYQQLKDEVDAQKNITAKIVVFSHFGKVQEAQNISFLAREIIDKNDSRLTKILSLLDQNKVYSDWTNEQRDIFWAEISQVATNIKETKIATSGKYNAWVELSQRTPQILGATGEKKYLVLFQNNTEIRPTGGFWGASASLTISHGAAKAAASGELPALAVPDQTLPADLLNILDANGGSQKTVHFINATSDVPQVVANALPVIEQSDGTKYDGVVLVDLPAISDLLKIVGPVNLAGVGQVTDQNILEKLVYLPENKENSGKVDKPKNQFGEVGVGLINKLSSEPLSTTARWINNNFRGKHIILNSPDKDLSKIFQEIKIDGNQSPASRNFIIYEELNFSGKQSLFISRKMRAIKTGERKYKFSVGFNYQDSELAQDQRYVENRSLIRIRTPKGSKLVFSSGGYQGDANQFETLETAAFSNILQIKPGETKELIFEYQLPEGLKSDYARDSSPNLVIQSGLPPVEENK